MTSDDSQSALPSEGIRINKYLASCGFESRRKADALIAEGAVEINGKRVEAPGARVMPGDYVKVNGKHALPKDEVSILLNKPRGFVCSRDPQGAEGTVFDLLPAKYRYVNYIGRLDADSEGLLILTNKGELNQRLGHPTGGVEKEYWVTLNQPFENSVLVQMLKGVRIPEGQAKAKYVCRLSARRACIVLEQGLKRQVRQMFACLGFRVRKLVRVRIGSLWGGDLAPGRAMLLTPEQEQLALVNPAPRKGMIGAAQAFPSGSALSAEQLDQALDEKNARIGLEEETDYVFNPADFETEEEAAADTRFRDVDEEEDFRPARPRRDRFADAAPRRGGDRGRRADWGKRPADRASRRFEDAPRRRFGRDAEGDRPARRFGRDAEGDRPARRFGRDAEGDRPARRFGQGAEGRFRKFSDDRRGDDRRPARGGFSRGGAKRGGFGGERRFSSPQGSRRGGGYGAPRRSAAPKRGGKRY